MPVGQPVGLYWEMYDAPGLAAPVEIAVTAIKADSKGEAPYPIGRPECPPRVGSPVTLR